MWHILGEEACRALLVLNSMNPQVREAMARASAVMTQRMRSDSRDRREGRYCCGKCSVALWRHLAAGGLVDQELLMRRGVVTLRKHRVPGGGYRCFPLYYTLLALLEMRAHLGDSTIRNELRHNAGKMERRGKSTPTPSDLYQRRRFILAERVLAMC